MEFKWQDEDTKSTELKREWYDNSEKDLIFGVIKGILWFIMATLPALIMLIGEILKKLRD